MSASSSTDSWSGGEGGRSRGTNNIIDLDKFMRGAVRPSRPLHQERNLRDALVVDAGGVERKIKKLGKLGNAGTIPRLPVAPVRSPPSTPDAASLTSCSSKTANTRPPRTKRFSHDSGLSDGSYTKRKHRTHRHMGAGDIMSRSANGVVAGVRTAASGASLRAFRAVCERALLEQQAQITRVTQLCERLTEHRLTSTTVEAVRTSRPARSTPRRKSESSSVRTSDVTSSSPSSRTRDSRFKDKHREVVVFCKGGKELAEEGLLHFERDEARCALPSTAELCPASDAKSRYRMNECKAYKIIMKKLDKLNTVFAARARPVAAPAQPYDLSSGSVSVSDKLVSTDPTFLKVSGGDVTSDANYDRCTASAKETGALRNGMASPPRGTQQFGT